MTEIGDGEMSDYRWLPLISWISVQVLLSSAVASQEMNGSPEAWISGTVIEQRKYSVLVASGGAEYELKLPDDAPIWLLLDRPQFDWDRRIVRLEVLASSPDGDPQHNIVREFDLPDPCWIDVEFVHDNERQRAMSGDVKRFVRYRLRSEDEQDQHGSADDPLRLTGRIDSIGADGLARIMVLGQSITAELGSREAYLTGKSAADLHPFATTLRVRAIQFDGEWMAQEVQFRAVVDHRPTDRPDLPKLLLLGDEVSLSYLHELKSELRGEFHVWHPPDNCRGSANWTRLDEWLGPYHRPDSKWDVICFNAGLADVSMPSAEYEANLRQWIVMLQKTGATLVWINTTPVPDNYLQRDSSVAAASEIVRLNESAQRVLADFPEIQSIDLHGWVIEQKDEGLKPWWRGRAPSFGPNHAPLVARYLVEKLRR